MHITRVEIENIRSIEHFRWEFDGDAAGWHVLLGVNGSGKSTVLRAMALALVGPGRAAALRQDWDRWLRQGRDTGSCLLRVEPAAPQLDPPTGSSGGQGWNLGVDFDRLRSEVLSAGAELDPSGGPSIWESGKGWFSSSFGPFRRFTGGRSDYDRLFKAQPKLARHLSIFGEDVALTECLDWLKELYVRRLDSSHRGLSEQSAQIESLLEQVMTFVNGSELLPHGVEMKGVTYDHVEFIDGNGCELPVLELSDGYRSVLSLAFELLRQLAECYPAEALFEPDDPSRVAVPGVVLIDEVDVHLHPLWQRKIGPWFRQHFPQIQFIVTTHSPFICQAAEVGSIWRLPDPGEIGEAEPITGALFDRLVYGDLMDAYSTGFFGEESTRSAASRRKHRRLAELNLRSLQTDLSPKDQREQEELRRIFPSTPDPGLAR